MPVKHEVPGSNPGASSNFRGAIAQLVEREVSSKLVVAFSLLRCIVRRFEG